MENDRYRFWPSTERPPLKWPNGAAVAVWVVPNIEHFPFDQPQSGGGSRIFPDVRNYIMRDYGNRMGVWRLMEVLDKYDIRGTVALNSDICIHEPQVVAAGVERNWEWMGHGKTNAQRMNDLDEAAERALIQEVLGTIEKSTGARPRGWLSPGLMETIRTPDLLAEAGIDYVADWGVDEQPIPMRVKSGRMLAMPYGHVADLNSFAINGWPPEPFYRMICDQFDGLYREGQQSGQVLAIALHPYIIGVPFRLTWLDKALEYITKHEDVWLATGGEIANWYYSHYYDQAIAAAPFPSERSQ
jgi:peptidoglycan/xylan/chitin deacetylase (PgdA/CDA1 family)